MSGKKPIRKRYTQGGIATEENTESVSGDVKIQQWNTLSKICSLIYCKRRRIGAGVLLLNFACASIIIIILMSIIYWYRGNTERPTTCTQDETLDNINLIEILNLILNENLILILGITSCVLLVLVAVTITTIMFYQRMLIKTMKKLSLKVTDYSTSKLQSKASKIKII